MKFNEFLRESKEKHAVMAFGRMNPVTIGHEKLVNKVQEVAKKVGGSAHIVVSHTQDAKKNPLTSEQKLKHAKRAFPGVNVTASDESAPNFLAQAAKLHKQGVTHFHMVGGSDRAEEYHKLLHKYNGVKGSHGSYNFKHIKVHSAGDRDPDAEGVGGMSASKMREHAANGNFKEFHKGVPSAMSDAHAKEMYGHVRKGMGMKEDIDEEFEKLLTENVNDRAIFKAVFLVGGPGSGKDYVLDNTLQGHGLTEISSDKALEFLMNKEDLNKTIKRIRNMAELRQHLAFTGCNGLIINGTGDDYDKIKQIKEQLEKIGYDTSMIMVSTTNEVSAARNIERGQMGGRSMPEDVRRQKWESVQNTKPKLAKIFDNYYMEFDNSENLKTASLDIIKAKKEEINNLHKSIQEFVAEPPKTKLILNSSVNEDLRKWFSKTDPAGDWKRINSKGEVVGPCAREPGEPKPKCMSRAKRESLTKQERAAAVRAKRRHDPDPERKGKPINVSNYGKGKISEENDNVKIHQKSIQNFRSTSIRIGHTSIAEQTSGLNTEGVTELTSANEYAKGDGIQLQAGNQADKSTKITLAQIRQRQKEKVKESIDKGIEPGLSMGQSGENLTRKGLKVKQNVKPFEEMIGAGGEDATSMSDFNDNVLKQKGINIKTFKAKRPIG